MCINQIRAPFLLLSVAAIFRSANRRDWETKRRTMIIFAKIYRFKYFFFVIKYRK